MNSERQSEENENDKDEFSRQLLLQWHLQPNSKPKNRLTQNSLNTVWPRLS